MVLHNLMQFHLDSERTWTGKPCRTFVILANLNSQQLRFMISWNTTADPTSASHLTVSTARREKFISTKVTQKEINFTTIVIDRKWITTNSPMVANQPEMEFKRFREGDQSNNSNVSNISFHSACTYRAIFVRNSDQVCIESRLKTLN